MYVWLRVRITCGPKQKKKKKKRKRIYTLTLRAVYGTVNFPNTGVRYECGVRVVRRLGACDLQESFWNRSIRSPPRDLVSYATTPLIISITCIKSTHQHTATLTAGERLSLHYSSGKNSNSSQSPVCTLSGQSI